MAYNLSGNLADYAFSVPAHLDSSDPGYVAGYDQCCQHLLVPPQSSCSLVLTYTTRGAATSLDYTIRLPRTVWKAGYKYTYALNFTPTEIIADPSVSAWDSDVTEVNF